MPRRRRNDLYTRSHPQAPKGKRDPLEKRNSIFKILQEANAPKDGKVTIETNKSQKAHIFSTQPSRRRKSTSKPPTKRW